MISVRSFLDFSKMALQDRRLFIRRRSPTTAFGTSNRRSAPTTIGYPPTNFGIRKPLSVALQLPCPPPPPTFNRIDPRTATCTYLVFQPKDHAKPDLGGPNGASSNAPSKGVTIDLTR